MVTIRKPKNALIISQPAAWWGSTWREALPAGNGVIGAAVYGGAANDVIMISHSDLWWQGHVGVLQDVSDKLKDVRKKIDDGMFKEADGVLSNALISKGYRPQLSYPLPLCDFKVQMELEKTAKEYGRILNMENGEVTVTFKDGTTRYDRSMFVSRAKNMIVYEITKSGNRNIDVKLSFDMHDRFNTRTPNAVSKLPEGLMTKYEKFFMYFSCRSDNGTEFGAVGFINHYGGEQIVETDGITIRGADKVLVTIKPYVESQREKEWKENKAALASIKATYEKLLKEHSPLHGKMFNSAEIDFEASGRDACIDDMLRDVFKQGDASFALLEKLWAYGRYLLISSSGGDNLPSSPYGLWCGDFKAPFSQINAAGSLQTMYEHAFSGNLTEYILSVFTYYESVMDDLRKNASRLYASRGIFIPSVMARGTGLLGSVDEEVIHFTGVAGWIAQLFYDYYLFTDDIKFLKARALPFMKEVALFYENFFKVLDQDYVSYPSFTPGTAPGNFSGGADNLHIARNSTIDFAIAKELLTNLIKGSEIAGANKSDIPKWADMLTRIPAYKQNEDGTIKEYCDDYLSDNKQTASTALFYPLFPGTEVNLDTPDSMKQFANTVKKRLINASAKQTGLSLVQYANIYARMGDGNTALEIINSLLRGMSMNNLVFAANDWRGMGIGSNDSWATYSLDVNMGVTNVIQDMLVQSYSSTIALLPALPDSITKGSVSGLLTRCGVEVSLLSWDKKKGVLSLKLKSKKASTIILKLPQGVKRYKGVKNEKIDLENGIISELSLPAGKVVAIEMRI